MGFFGWASENELEELTYNVYNGFGLVDEELDSHERGLDYMDDRLSDIEDHFE